MNYSDLIKYLKVCNQNLQTLHRHLRSNNFFKEHEILESYYDKMGDYVDMFVELGMSLGYEDVSIADAINTYELLPIKDYSRAEAFNYVHKSFNEIINIMNELKDTVNGFVVSKFEEVQYELQIEANYKIKRVFQAKID